MGIRFGINLPGPFYISAPASPRLRRGDGDPPTPEEEKVWLWMIGGFWIWWVLNFFTPLSWGWAIPVTIVTMILIAVIKRNIL